MGPTIRLRTPAKVAGNFSEWWPGSIRNPGRDQIGMVAGITSESARRGANAVAAQQNDTRSPNVLLWAQWCCRYLAQTLAVGFGQGESDTIAHSPKLAHQSASGNPQSDSFVPVNPLGERNVDLAIDALIDTDIKLAVMHHPTDWLADFDEYSVSSRLSSSFDVLFCGHTHRPIPQTRTTAQGTSILSQTGSVYANRRWFNGYQILTLDASKGDCCFEVRTYFDTPRRVFDAALNISSNGKVCFPYSPAHSTSATQLVESVLREVRPTIRQNAADHMNMIGNSGTDVTDIKEGFIAPPLSIKSEDQSDDNDNDTSKFEEIPAEDMLRDTGNFLITGGRETGKTSLLHYLSVLAAEGNIDTPRIPVILNCSTLRSGLYNLKRAIGSYLGNLPKGVDIDQAIRDGRFIFLADGLASSAQAAVVKGHIDLNPKNRWICIDQPLIGSLQRRAESADALPSFREVRIGHLPRRSIRALARRWSPTIGQSDDEVFDAVMAQIKRDALPRTGYMVTLLLWAMQQESEFERINEAVLLANVVDHLLGKADFTQATLGTFDPRAKEIVLEQFARFFQNSGDFADIDEASKFLVELFQSKMLPFKAIDVINELTKCGILDRSENRIFFKYRCFQEYFYASLMRSDQKFCDKVISNGDYRRIARECEFLSGLRRENSELINAISGDIQQNQPNEIRILKSADFDVLTEVKAGVSVTRKRLEALKKKRLSSDQIDDLMDAADRRALRRAAERNGKSVNGKEASNADLDLFGKKLSESNSTDEQNATRMSPLEFVHSNDILARIIRNSDFTDFDVKGPATRAVLNNAVRICLLIRNEFVSILDESFSKNYENGLTSDDKKSLIVFVNRMLVMMSASLLSDQLSSPNIVPMIREILKEGNLSLAEKIFITFLLQASRASDWHEKFGDLLKDRPDSGFLVECILGHIQGMVNSQYLDDNENAKVRAVIDSAQEVLGWGPAEKSKILTDLRKAALQADIKDQRA